MAFGEATHDIITFNLPPGWYASSGFMPSCLIERFERCSGADDMHTGTLATRCKPLCRSTPAVKAALCIGLFLTFPPMMIPGDSFHPEHPLLSPLGQPRWQA